MNPELHVLSAVGWQYFLTLTFRREKQLRRFGPQMFVSLMRAQAKQWSVHHSMLLWVLRSEHGAITDRVHYHALIAGLPLRAGLRNCLVLMSQWEKLGGGIARVSRYESTLDGLTYVLKGSQLSESRVKRWAGDYHEFGKFGSSCEVTLSLSVCRLLVNRCRDGDRDAGSHETRGTDTTSSAKQGPVGSQLATSEAKTNLRRGMLHLEPLRRAQVE